MTPPAEVLRLVERFEEQREDYRRGRYNEAQLRQDFLNPFFKALGWDVHNERGWSEAYREVIHEAAIKVGGRTKAPDYCFRAGGGKPSFFVEAKKPSVDIREALSPAYQLRRYAWSAKLPVSILTDFEEFAVYDCRIRPVKTDKASTARIIYLKYTEYVERWEELNGLFSPEAIRRGALDRFVASKKVKKGTAAVDAAFLDEIESWREVLARNIALRNQPRRVRACTHAKAGWKGEDRCFVGKFDGVGQGTRGNAVRAWVGRACKHAPYGLPPQHVLVLGRLDRSPSCENAVTGGQVF